MKSRTARIGSFGALALAVALPALAATTGGTAVVAGRSVQFFDSSSEIPASWEWDFTYEVGVTSVDSREQNPFWTFADPGIWSVRLEACNVFGCGASIQEIEVVPPCSLVLDLVVTPVLVDTLETFEACHTITAGSGVSVVDPGLAVFRAGRSVAFGNGFSVGGGARLRVEIDPLLDIP